LASDGGSFFAELNRRNVWRVGIAYVIASWLILQVIDVIEPLIGMPLWASQLVLVVLIIGFPLALVFSWAFEVTPGGLKREKDIDRSQSVTHETGRRLDKITIVIFALAVVMMVIDRNLPPASVPIDTTDTTTPAPRPTTELPSIAVLPFVNMSSDEGSAYFSDGLADTLLHMLAQIGEMRVAARTSSFRFREPGADIKDIAVNLGVGNILEGSVQKSGNRIRVTAQLIEAETGFHLWSGNFDRDLDDVFAIQDEIATEVVGALKISLLGEEAARLTARDTENLDAYTEFLLGIDKLDLSTTRAFEEAEEHFARATELDPEYARAWGMLGLTYLRMLEWGSGTRDVLLPKAQDAASNAMRLDNDLAVAITVLGAVELHQGNKDVAEQLLRRAVQADPNFVEARSYYARALFQTGRDDEALRVLDEALTIDPLSPEILFSLAAAHRSKFEYDKSITFLDRLAEIEPLNPSAPGLRGDIEYDYGYWARAAMDHVRAARLDPDDPEIAVVVGETLLCLELRDEAERWFDRAAEISPEHPATRGAYLLLELYAESVSDAGVEAARDLLDDELENRESANDRAVMVIWRHAVENDNVDAALEYFGQRYPEYFDPAGADLRGYYRMLRIGDLFRRADRPDDARRLLGKRLDRYQAFIDRESVMVMAHLQVPAAMGDRDLLLRALPLYVRDVVARKESPSLWPLRVKLDPLFDFVHNEPEFNELVDLLTSRAAEQREQLLDMNGGVFPLPE
jgi:TolB-like protein/cytochrome c-type biogenesis protein CcmH/NrfG